MGGRDNRGYLDVVVPPTVVGVTPPPRPEGPAVFDVTCTTCSRRQLIFAGQLRGIVNDDDGIHVVFQCRCGALGAWRTGRASATAAAA